ncbi:MAG: hypothetical protein ABJR05_09910 [Balneola sp.]
MEQYQFTFNLASIKTLSFSIREPKDLKNATDLNYEINYDFIPKIGIDFDDKKVKIVLDVNGTIQNTDELLLDSSVEFIFSIHNLEDLISKKKDGFEIKDSQWTVVILSVALSTLRGIIFAKSEGSFLQKKPIPVIDPNKFIKIPEQDLSEGKD